MTILNTLKIAISSAKKQIIDNMEYSKVYTGNLNPFGDRTLLLDNNAEEEIISVLDSSGVNFAILTEERGLLIETNSPEYLALVDPIDGSTNLSRGIPLVSIGISVVPYREVMTSDDAEISIIESVFSDERYIAIKGKGVTKNGKRVTTSPPVAIKEAIISYDTKRTWDTDFLRNSLRTMNAVQDTRRTASNLLDLCWTAAGMLDAMVDLRDMLPIIHLCGTHMVIEAGGYVLDSTGSRFNSMLTQDTRMSFVAASNESLARQILDVFNGL